MKNEIKQLLEAKEGTLEINSLFTLKRWTLDPDTDLLKRDSEHLIIEMKNRYKSHREIMSRDANGIKKEISKYMSEMMDAYKDDLLRRFDGGQLGKYL